MERKTSVNNHCGHPAVQETYEFLFSHSPCSCKAVFSDPEPGPTSGILVMVISETIDWIIRNLKEDLDADRVSLKAGYSRWHFQREFRRITGLSLNDFIRVRRIIASWRAIQDGTKPLHSIAPEYGFTNELGLLRSFRKYIRTTPAAIRHLALQNI